MNHTLLKLRSVFISLLTFGCMLTALISPSHIFALEAQPQGLTNPALDNSLAGNATEANSGKTFSNYILVIWRGLIVIGGLAVVLYFVIGAVSWITAGGDSGKINKARDQMTQAVIGMVVLAASYMIINFVGGLFGLNFLKFNIPTPNGQ